MSSFFPSGIDVRDISSPKELLDDAKREWVSKTVGEMTLDFDSNSADGMAITCVRAIHVQSRRSANLFCVGHRPESPYPATIEPEDDDLPNVLRKSYYQSGSPGFNTFGAAAVAALSGATEGRFVKNDWVAETPAEFRQLLTKIFNSGYVKSVVYNLIASGQARSAAVPGKTEGPPQ
jgi:hypothetical protein